jgi:serine/threonine protein kinase
MSDNPIGKTITGFRIESELGKGGMAKVYVATQLSVGRPVAFKVIDARLTQDEQFLIRFEREAKTMASLQNSHILKLFDYGTAEGITFMVTELMTGGSLADMLKKNGKKGLPQKQALTLLSQIGSALDYAHKRGVIHRDLKPHNVLLDEGGRAFLTDFGVAKIITGDSQDLTNFTNTGVALGTPAYMSPEQWTGLPLDGRSDIYALAIMAYEMLVGKTPFNGDTPAVMMYEHLQKEIPSLQASGDQFPLDVDRVIQRGLAKDRNERFNTAEDFIEMLRRALAGEPIPLLTQDLEKASSDRRRHLTGDDDDERPTKITGGAKRAIILSAVATGAGFLALLLLLSRGNPGDATITPTAAAAQASDVVPTQTENVALATETIQLATTTPTITPSFTNTLTATPSLTSTPTASHTPTFTLTSTQTPTFTPTLNEMATRVWATFFAGTQTAPALTQEAFVKTATALVIQVTELSLQQTRNAIEQTQTALAPTATPNLGTRVWATFMAATNAGAANTATPSTVEVIITIRADARPRLRGGPGTDFEVLALIASNTRLTALGISADGDWFYVEYQGQKGWVANNRAFNTTSGDISALPVIYQ